MNILIIGAGGHGSVVADIIDHLPQFTLVGFLDAKIEPGTKILGYEVLGTPDSLSLQVIKHQIEGVVIGVGDNWTRSRLAEFVRDRCPELCFPPIIHPSAQIGKNVTIGQGSVVMPGAIVNCNVRVGEFCILNTRSSLDHDTHAGDFVSFAPKSCTGGGSVIGHFSAICLGANLIDRITIGEHTVIGAGSTVLQNQPSFVVAYGTPARKINDRQPGDRYL